MSAWSGLKSGKSDHLFEEPPFRFTPETVGAGFFQLWKAMDREGVSRFPGADSRIPNFAGAKLAAQRLAAHRLWKRARVIKVKKRWPRLAGATQ